MLSPLELFTELVQLTQDEMLYQIQFVLSVAVQFSA